MWFAVCFLLTWCWSGWLGDTEFYENIYGIELNYNGNVKLERVWLKTDDLDEITDLFQEAWDNSDFRDSLLIAKKYSQGLLANAFSQDNLDALEKWWLELSNIKKTQIWLDKYWDKLVAVLVEYEIVWWFIDEVPLIYVSQLFVPKDDEMILMSYVTEDKSSHLNALDMFKNIK